MDEGAAQDSAWHADAAVLAELSEVRLPAARRRRRSADPRDSRLPPHVPGRPLAAATVGDCHCGRIELTSSGSGPGLGARDLDSGARPQAPSPEPMPYNFAVIRAFRSIHPRIDSSAFVDQSAQVIGDVHVGVESSVWMNVVIRGGVNKIRIGARTNWE